MPNKHNTTNFMFNKNTNKTLYKRSLLIYSAVLSALIIASQVLVLTFLFSYEKSIPHNCAQNYINNLSVAEWKDILGNNIYGSKYQSKDETVNTAFDKYLKNACFVFRRIPSESKGGINVFSFSDNDDAFGNIKLKKVGNGFFNMPRWSVFELEISNSFISKINPQTVAFFPKDAVFCINDNTIDISQYESCNCPLISEFEPNKEELFKSYSFRAPCGEYNTSATLNSINLTKTVLANDIVAFDLLPTNKIDIKICAPNGSEVYVNDVRVSTKYIINNKVAYPFLSALEAGKSNLLFSTEYSISGLYNEPNVRVIFGGEELTCFDNNDSNVYSYSLTSTTNNYTLTVPSGSMVFVNGIEITDNDKYMCKQSCVYSEVELYKDELINPIKCNVYSLNGLLFEPDIVVKNTKGQELRVSNIGKTNYSCEIGTYMVNAAEYEALAKSFTIDMIEYFLLGRNHIETTFNKVISHTRTNSNAYNVIMNTYSGVFWRPQHTFTYNNLYVDKCVEYADNAYLCDVHYDVAATRISNNSTRSITGVYRLLYIKNGNSWKIVELFLLNEDE